MVGAAAAEIFGMPVTVPRPDEYVAPGAARQAARALARTPEPPAWPRPDGGAAGRKVRDAYARARAQVHQVHQVHGAGAEAYNA